MKAKSLIKQKNMIIKWVFKKQASKAVKAAACFFTLMAGLNNLASRFRSGNGNKARFQQNLLMV
jgi:hypothetical protein